MAKQGRKIDVMGALVALVMDRVKHPKDGRKGVASFEEVPGVMVNGKPARVQQILKALLASIAEKPFSKVISGDWGVHKAALAEALEDHNIQQIGPMRSMVRGQARYFSVLFPADADAADLPQRGAVVSDTDVAGWTF